MVTVSRIFVYPIKSTAGVELSAAEARERGLEHDRRYVVTDANGRFFTARRYPRMLLIQTRIHDGGLTVSATGQPGLALTPAAYPPEHDCVTVWHDNVQGQRCGPDADAWFSEYLGTDARLYYMDAGSHRPVRGGGGEVSFADAAPLLVLSEASVADLNMRLAEAVSMRNFRPNLVVSGVAAYGEDGFGDFTAGSARFKAMWRCSRCVLTTIDPDTGVRNSAGQPLKTLMDYRRKDNVALFGLNVGVAEPGRIAVGDELIF